MALSRISKVASPLSDAEWDELGDSLQTHAQFDLDSLMGFLSAIVVAPGLVPPSSWLPVVLGEDGLAAADSTVLELLPRAYNTVLRGIEEHRTYTPEGDDEEACALFADGYVAGAELDPEWIGDVDRSTFFAPMAYLCERRELVPPDMLEGLDSDPDAVRFARERLGSLVLAADDSFRKVRLELAAKAKNTSTAVSAKVGRNEPCPCGSGKNFKKCCGGS